MWQAGSRSSLLLAGTAGSTNPSQRALLAGNCSRSLPVRLDRLAQAIRHRDRLLGLQRHHRRHHARAQPHDIVAMADDGDGQRGPAEILDQQSQIDHFADAAWDLEIAFDVHEREPVSAAGDELGIIVTELLTVPVLDQAVEHVEVVWKVDDARRIAMREANRHAAGKRPARRYKPVFPHRLALLCFLRRRKGANVTAKLKPAMSAKECLAVADL